MADFWKKNKKTIVTVGMGLTGYSIISKAFVAFPQLPTMLTQPIIGQVSTLTIAAGLTLFGAVMMWTNY